MNLGGDHLKFAFDKAELRPEDRELLSRVAGILISATDYTISVNGHTDDVGTAEYNQKLSERRAQAVYDYLVEAGLSKDILSVQGHGKSRPLVPATSDAGPRQEPARGARNRQHAHPQRTRGRGRLAPGAALTRQRFTYFRQSCSSRKPSTSRALRFEIGASKPSSGRVSGTPGE